MATASPSTPAQPKKKKLNPFSRWSDLFFFRRRPRLRGVRQEWIKPDTEEGYQQQIHDEGFISSVHWKDGDVTKHPIIMRDLKDLEQYLLPTFFQFSEKSKYYQNQFYLYQWVFVWGAFLTTMFGTFATMFSAPAGTTSTEAVFDLRQFFSILTAIVGAATAFTTALSQRGEPQKRWGKNRRLAEELRMHYFTYLSHLPPYELPDRVQKLRENVINIRVKEQENV